MAYWRAILVGLLLAASLPGCANSVSAGSAGSENGQRSSLVLGLPF